jgi:hypothetical protein
MVIRESSLERCSEVKFDSTYPMQLNGIISSQDFLKSIENINRRISSKRSKILLAVSLPLCMVIGIGLFIGGLISGGSGLPIILSGCACVALGILIPTVGCWIVQTKRSSRLHDAIAKESAKYSEQSPRPCTWQLNPTSTTAESDDGLRTYVIHHVSSHRSSQGGICHSTHVFSLHSNRSLSELATPSLR